MDKSRRRKSAKRAAAEKNGTRFEASGMNPRLSRDETQQSGSRKRASDFIVGRSARKMRRRQRLHVPEQEIAEGEIIINKLLSEFRDAIENEPKGDDKHDSDIENLRDAVQEAREADENDDSDEASLCSMSDFNEHDGTAGDDSSVDVTISARNEKDDSVEENNDSDSDSGTTNYQMDMKALKESDPSFFKYLLENDAELLKFNSNNDEALGNGNVRDKEAESEGEEDDEEEEEEEERIAAAEAGLELDTNTADEKVQKTKTKLVDMSYLRSLEADLSNRRTALKACQDLVRIFRSGRELAVSNDILKRNKKNAAHLKKRRPGKGNLFEVADEDDEISEDYTDDQSYVAGKIRFASARAYQKAMNLAISGIQDTLDSLLGKPNTKEDASSSVLAWSPEEHNRWKHLEPMFRVFVFHILALTEHMKDAQTLRFLLKRLTFLVPYTKARPSLARKLVTLALSLWSGSDRDISSATKLRAFLLLHSIGNEESNTELVLRKVCNAFISNIGNVCNLRTLPSIQFAVSCIIELFGIDMGASYTVAFTYIRQIAVTLRAVLSSKDAKSDIDKIHNWSTISGLQLWSRVLSRYGGDDELESLIYPYVQVCLGILRLQSSPKNIPVRAHICGFVIDLASNTGVYVPIFPHLLAILRCSEFKRVPKVGTIKALEWRAILRVEDEAVGTKSYLGDVVQNVVLQLAKYFSSISKHFSFPEISHAVSSELNKVAKEMRVAEWKRDLLDLRDQLKKTAVLICEKRANSTISPSSAIGKNGTLEIVAGFTDDMKTPIQRFYDLELERKGHKESIRDVGDQLFSSSMSDEL